MPWKEQLENLKRNSHPDNLLSLSRDLSLMEHQKNISKSELLQMIHRYLTGFSVALREDGSKMQMTELYFNKTGAVTALWK